MARADKISSLSRVQAHSQRAKRSKVRIQNFWFAHSSICDRGKDIINDMCSIQLASMLLSAMQVLLPACCRDCCSTWSILCTWCSALCKVTQGPYVQAPSMTFQVKNFILRVGLTKAM